MDTDKQHLPAMLRAAAAHKGAALVEIYQNCPVFNDGAFDALRDKKANAINAIRLEHGQPITFNGGTQQVVARRRDRRPADRRPPATASRVVHDAHRDDPSLAFALSRLALAPERADADRHLPRRRPARCPARSSPRSCRPTAPASASAELDALLHAGDTWTVA